MVEQWCRTDEPVLRDVGGRDVACHLAESIGEPRGAVAGVQPPHGYAGP
jgi:hypothetical protein